MDPYNRIRSYRDTYAERSRLPLIVFLKDKRSFGGPSHRKLSSCELLQRRTIILLSTNMMASNS